MSDQHVEERRKMALEAIATGGTLTEAWSQAAKVQKGWGETSGLDGRTRAVAKFISPGSRVVDIGASGGRMERFLPEGCAYQPVDLVQTDPRTIIVDLNREPLPDIKGDIATVVGVLEYLHNVPAFLERLAVLFPKAIATYYPLDLDPARDRIASGWYNAMNWAELAYIARKAGWTQIEEHRHGRPMMIYELGH